MPLLALDTHALLNPITSLDLENCISSGNPAHKPPVREVLDEKDDLFGSLRATRRWGESKMKSGEGGIALENSC